jgi:hypothetical protein
MSEIALTQVSLELQFSVHSTGVTLIFGVTGLSDLYCFVNHSFICIGNMFRLTEVFLDEGLHNLHSSPNIIRRIKSRRIKGVGHVARMGEKRNRGFWW